LKRFAALCFVVSFALLTGCAGLLQKKPLSLDHITVAEIKHRVEQNSRKYHSMKARADISVESPRMNFSASSSIIIKKPDSIFIKIKAPFGIGVAAIFMDRNQFLMYNSFENSAYRGDTGKIPLKQFLPVDLKLAGIIQAFAGIHLIDCRDADSLAIDRNKYLIIASRRGQLRKYWVDPKRFVVTKFELQNATRKPLLRFEYKQFEKNKQVILPKFIQIYQPTRKTRLTILYTSRKPNCKLKAKDFVLKIPAQTRWIEL